MIYLFLAQGFEEIEALTPVDLLRRAKCEVKTVGIGGKVITGSHGISVTADITDAEFADEAPEMVVLPGGMPGAEHLDASPVVDRALRAAVGCGGFVAAICASPFLLGKRGMLEGKRATCYPGFEKDLRGADVCECAVVRDGKFITGAGMGVATAFGLALVEALMGKETADRLFRGILADRA